MLRRFIEQSRRLLSARDGNFAVLAGLSAVPLIFLIGGVIDLSIAQSRRTTIQNAADAASLGAAKQYVADPDPAALKGVAKQFFDANTGELFRTKATLVFDGIVVAADESREVRLHVDYAYDPIFIPKTLAGLAGFGNRSAEIRSAASVSDTTVEVAMVLDTSGSMRDRPTAGGRPKIETLRSEAQILVNKFFDAAPTDLPKPTQIAVVPFAGSVNVGARNWDKFWMDPGGIAPTHNENFDWTTYTDANGLPMARKNGDNSFSLVSDPSVKLTRQYVFKTMRQALGPQQADAAARFEPAGCVETRLGPAGITDVAPNSGKPETLFVPWFAPDEPDDIFTSRYTNSYVDDQEGRGPLPYDFHVRQVNMNKYLLSPKSGSPEDSPNFTCDSDPILPLQTAREAVIRTIAGLQAEGSTNVEEGVAWGWRTLSSGEPFTEGRSSGERRNVKAIILMTDGENTYYTISNPNLSRYGSHGFSADGHIFGETAQPSLHNTTNFTLAMEARTRKVCENAKNDGRRPMLDTNGAPLVDSKGPVTSDGVLIYTIAFDIPASIAPRVKQVLTDCASYKTADLRRTTLPYASKGKYYYPAKDAEQLRAAFDDILASLTKLRISQ